MTGSVLGITYVNAHGALSCATIVYADMLRQMGYAVDVVNAAAPGAMENLYRRLENEKFEFCFGIQGVGSNLMAQGKNVWSILCVPFVGIHYDNPCGNIFNHANVSPYVANLYCFESMREIHERYIGTPQVVGSAPFQVLGPFPQATPSFKDRPIKLLYMKSGERLDECIDTINGLALRDDIWEIIKQTEDNPNLSVCDLLQFVFDHNKLDRNTNFELYWGIAHWMDLYLRRKRAIGFVEWLKYQDGAVIIGDGWDHIDKTGTRAEFRASLDGTASYELYQQTQFVCNTNPYGRDIVHERSVFGLVNDCCVITDRNAWWTAHFGDVPALALFDWNRSLKEQLNTALDNLDHAACASRTGRHAALRQFTGTSLAGKIVETAKKVQEFASQRAA
jgi:hypothetical protein